MTVFSIEDAVRQLTLTNVQVQSKEIRASCPLAKTRHSKGTDNTPSFFVNKRTGQVKCHGCDYSGNLFTLTKELEEIRGEDYRDLRRGIRELIDGGPSGSYDRVATTAEYYPAPPKEIAGIILSAEEQKELTSIEITSADPAEQDLSHFEPLKKGEGLEYLLGPKRNLSPETIMDWELMWHPKSRRVAMPIRDLNGKLVGISGRAAYEGSDKKFLHSTGFNRRLYLYGEHKVIPGKRGLLVEGNFDPIGLWEKGYYNGVAIMGSQLSVVQRAKIKRLFSDVIYIRDGDAAGKVIADRVTGQLRRDGIWVVAPEVPEGLDPDQLSNEFLESILGPPDRKCPTNS